MLRLFLRENLRLAVGSMNAAVEVTVEPFYIGLGSACNEYFSNIFVSEDSSSKQMYQTASRKNAILYEMDAEGAKNIVFSGRVLSEFVLNSEPNTISSCKTIPSLLFRSPIMPSALGHYISIITSSAGSLSNCFYLLNNYLCCLPRSVIIVILPTIKSIKFIVKSTTYLLRALPNVHWP